MTGHHFISYSAADGREFARRLADALLIGPPSTPVWLFERQLEPGRDWDAQLAEAIAACESLVFCMTRDSVRDQCTCKQEWTHALSYKKPITPLLVDREAHLPFRLNTRQYIDFTGDFEAAMARLRRHLEWLASPAGALQAMKDRLADAERDLSRATDLTQIARIQDDMDLLRKQIAEQERIVADPQGAARRVEESIAAGLERERKPEKPVGGEARTKFINPPPGVAPTYFQDRYEENKLVAQFLRDESCRLMTVVGRAGIGKTAMVCRLLKALESGRLPDDLGEMSVSGIVYLSARGTRQVSVPNLFADLCKLLPEETARGLDALYKNPQASAEAKFGALLAAFPGDEQPQPVAPTLVLLDNFEDVIDPETHDVKDGEMDEALRALLRLPHHAVKVILTTRIAPRALALVEPGRQFTLHLDEGLDSPFAENILREMDADGKVGLKGAPDALLAEARERTLGYPRALEALYAILSADRHTSLREILDAPVGAVREPPLPENVVEALVGEAFNRLDPNAQRVMQALAVYNRPVTPAAVDYVLQPYLPGINSAPVLNRLANMQFARREAGHYYLHPVDRAYAFARVPVGQESDRDKAGIARKPLNLEELLRGRIKPQSDYSGPPVWTQFALLHRGAEYFKQARKPRESWKEIDALAPQLAEFDLRYAGGDYDTAADVLTDIDFDYLLLWGHYRLMVEMHERLQGKLSDLALKQISVGNLGSAYYSTGQYQKAITCYEQALAIAHEKKDRRNEGAWLGNLGNCYAELGQTVRAIDCYEQALAIAREIGDRRGEGNRLGNLGNCNADLGQTGRAIEYYEQALVIAREIGDRRIEGGFLGNLGSCYAELGQTGRAIEYYEQALVIAREIGDWAGEGRHLGNLGGRYAELGQIARATGYYEQALAIDREIGNRRSEGVALGNLAKVLIDEGRYDDAIQRAMESVKIGEEISSPNSFNNSALALAYLYSGDLNAARAAVETTRRYDEPQNNHFALALLGDIALRQGDRAAAQEAFTAALAQADALLALTAQNFAALDSKGLALAGLVLCENLVGAGLVPALGADTRPAPTQAAIAAYRAARAIDKDAGIVGRVLRLLDALASAHPQGAEMLAAVRAAAAGEMSGTV